MAVGKNGTITIEDGQGVETILEFKDGMEIDQGACSTHFLSDGNEEVIVNPLIAVIVGTLNTVEDVQDLMEVASQWPDNPLIKVAVYYEGSLEGNLESSGDFEGTWEGEETGNQLGAGVEAIGSGTWKASPVL